MNIYRRFSLLMEHSLLQEYSSAIALARDKPSLPKVLATARNEIEIPYNLEWESYKPTKALPRPPSYAGSGLFVLVIGPDGTAIVKGSQRTRTRYSFKAFVGDDNTGEITTLEEYDSFRKIFNSIKSIIGFKALYIAYMPKLSVDALKKQKAKHEERKKYKDQSLEGYLFKYMLKRLQPILLKVVVQTEADIKGFINTMISSGNYQTARQKLGYLERLNQVKNRLELSDNLNLDANDLVLIQLRNAMLLTAKYLYPEEIPDDQGFLYGHFPFYSNVADTLAKVVKAVEQGDLKTLSIVLGFFKRSLLFPN